MAYIGINPNQDVATKFVEVFTGDGVTTTFALPVAPGSTFVVDVSVGGVDQVGGVNFNISGKDLVFLTGAPPNGALIKAMFAAEISTGDQARVKNSRKVQDYVATAGQTSFSVNGGYDPGQVDVYLNGIKLTQGVDFTASTGTVVVLTEPAVLSDEVQIVAYGSFIVADAVRKSGDSMTGDLTVTGTVSATTISGNIDAGNLVSGTVPTARLPGESLLTLGTAVTASGTAVDFTGIPAWAKRITVMFSGVSTNGSISPVQIQLGDAGGFETTEYIGAVGTRGGESFNSSGFLLHRGQTASVFGSGTAVISNVSGNAFTCFGTWGTNSTDAPCMFSGSKTLSDTLTQLRITTVNGTDTFDAGTINIMYE